MKSNPPKKEILLGFGDEEKQPSSSNARVAVNVMKYDMASFLDQCVQRYIELAGSKIVGKLKPASTPFLDESKAEFDENEIIAKI